MKVFQYSNVIIFSTSFAKQDKGNSAMQRTEKYFKSYYNPTMVVLQDNPAFTRLQHFKCKEGLE